MPDGAGAFAVAALSLSRPSDVAPVLRCTVAAALSCGVAALTLWLCGGLQPIDNGCYKDDERGRGSVLQLLQLTLRALLRRGSPRGLGEE
eukprot:CAMPEP_0195142868 /NCGR_PEP_ID=MMETSP0448-20130528/165331_1 /TAXON_ID=66468 /ORGANISM="Heterocapsa triquestra, Strain CCMP 448" /LENGTH=89 /DNA_ID=CAMNT_0040181281 /DNA_START=56 /DNA_END=322 /DNA_ORIENTATION=+